MSIVIKGGGSGDLATVTADGELLTRTRLDTTQGNVPVTSANLPGGTFTFQPGQTGLAGPVNVAAAGNCTFVIKNANPALPFGGNPVVIFEQSDDGQSWAALPAMRSDTNVVKSLRLLSPNVADAALVFDAETEGASWVRARVVTAAAVNAMVINVIPGALPFTPFVSVVEPVRDSLLISNAGIAIVAKNVEQMLSLNRVVGGRSFDTATSFTVPAGKTYVMQNFTISQVGSSNVSSASTIFKLRFSPSGPVTTASPVVMQARLATVAEAGDYNSVSIPLPGGFHVAGDGQAQFGMSVICDYNNAAPTVDVLWVGYQY